MSPAAAEALEGVSSNTMIFETEVDDSSLVKGRRAAVMSGPLFFLRPQLTDVGTAE